MKARYDKYKSKLWHFERNRAKSKLLSRLHPDQLAALERQNKRGIKWSPETIKDALVFKMKWGTTGFSDFVNYLPIFPSVRTLQKEMQHIRFESGILDEVFDMLKCVVSDMDANDRDCMIAADEMAIRAGHVFDSSTKKMIGQCTFPTHVGPAKKILVIVCGGICRRWKVVVAYYFMGKEDPEIKRQKTNLSGIAFKNILMIVIEKCEAIGLKVHSLTTDMGSENRALWKVYGVGCSRDSEAVVSIEHPIRSSDRFFFLPDPVHLFKNILTMLDSNSIIYLPQDILCSEKLTHPTVEMQHIDDILQFELNLELKIAYRLKKNKLHCKNQFEKMKVGTARSVFNRRTEIALKKYAEHTGNNAYKTTAFFVGLVSRWFDLMSNRSLKLALGLKNEAAYEEPINHISKTAHVFRFMTIGVNGYWKPVQTGVIMACECILQLQSYFLKERSYQFLFTGRFCQCCLENIFSAVRVRQPVPNPLQVKQNLKVIVLSQVCTNFKNTSYEDGDDVEIEEIKLDFIKFSKSMVLARRAETTTEEFMEASALALPRLKDRHMNLLDPWEWYIIYDIAGSVVHSVKISNMKVCDTCLNSVQWKGNGHHSYALLVELRNYKDNSLIEVSDDCFKAIMKCEIAFREVRNNFCDITHINIVNFLVSQMKYIWEECNIPSCHSITEKICYKFFTMRLRCYSIKQCEELDVFNKHTHTSKTMAMHASVTKDLQ